MKIQAIGLSGFAGSGKTLVAKYLESTYGFERRHIATTLRDMLKVLLKANGLDDNTIWAYLEGPLKEDFIPEIGVTSRQAQITLGTEWGRECISENIWVDTWMRGIGPGDRVINDSVRFPNERDAIEDIGGLTIRIDRKGVGPVKFQSGYGKLMYRLFGSMNGVHPSERIDLIQPDWVVENNGTIGDLYEQIDEIMELADVAPVDQDRRIAA